MHPRHNFPLLDDLGAGGPSGGIAAPAPAAPAGAPAASPASAPASALATPPQGFTPDKIPEKYRVNKEDGTLDLEASTLKLTDGYSHLAKRLGSGDAPPEAADKYTLAGLPDGTDIDALRGDPKMQEFLKTAHGAGLNDAQVSMVMNQWLERASMLAEGGAALNVENGVAALKAVWKDDASFSKNLQLADRAINEFIDKAGLKSEDVHQPYVAEINGEKVVFPALANHPAFGRLMAAIGPELGEDTSPRNLAQSVPQDWQAQVDQLRAHEAYANTEHKEHAIVRQKMATLYAQKYRDE